MKNMYLWLFRFFLLLIHLSEWWKISYIFEEEKIRKKVFFSVTIVTRSFIFILTFVPFDSVSYFSYKFYECFFELMFLLCFHKFFIQGKLEMEINCYKRFIWVIANALMHRWVGAVLEFRNSRFWKKWQPETFKYVLFQNKNSFNKKQN